MLFFAAEINRTSFYSNGAESLKKLGELSKSSGYTKFIAIAKVPAKVIFFINYALVRVLNRSRVLTYNFRTCVS